jgi:hypothetical protein
VREHLFLDAFPCWGLRLGSGRERHCEPSHRQLDQLSGPLVRLGKLEGSRRAVPHHARPRLSGGNVARNYMTLT